MDSTVQPNSSDEIVLLVGLGLTSLPDIQRVRIIQTDSCEEAVQAQKEKQATVIMVEDRWGASQVREILSQSASGKSVNVVFSNSKELSEFQALIDDDLLFYLSQRPTSDDQIVTILESALAQARRAKQSNESKIADLVSMGLTPKHLSEVVEQSYQVAIQQSWDRACAVLTQSAKELLQTARCQCLLYDAFSDSLSVADEKQEESAQSASVGLVSYALRTQEPVVVENAGSDPRYDRDLDDPLGDGSESILATPIIAPDKTALAVLSLVRKKNESRFEAHELKLIEFFIQQITPSLMRLVLKDKLAEADSSRQAGLFRRQALEHHQRDNSLYGKPLLLTSSWMKACYWILVVLFFAGLFYLITGQIHEYARGPAFLRLEGRTSVTAVVDGVVDRVFVRPGEYVEKGQQLAQFHASQEKAELERIEREFNLHLINRLRDPSDENATQALIGLSSQKNVAEVRLGQRKIVAPHEGLVGDIRMRPGQRVAAGEVLLSLREKSSSGHVIAVLPGEYRPQLRNAMTLRLELTGFQHTFIDLHIDQVADEVIGPEEAKRFLGSDVAQELLPRGPVVLAQASFPSNTFVYNGKQYAFYDGMTGIASVAVRSDPLLFSIVPGLDAIFRTSEQVPVAQKRNLADSQNSEQKAQRQMQVD